VKGGKENKVLFDFKSMNFQLPSVSEGEKEENLL